MPEDYRLIVRRTGGPDVIEREAVAMPEPGPTEAIVRHEAIGLNFIDTYHRSGLYPLQLPSGLGSEAAGVVERVGSDVTSVRPGQRVAYAGGPLGAYSTVRALAADLLVPLPDTIDARTAAASMLKGLTVDMLVGECGEVRLGQTVLVHAAGGGVGSLLVPWLRALGATVIAHVETAAKVARVEALGADVVLSDGFDTLAAHVRQANGGRGVDTVFDGVGRASWDASIASLAKRGLMVSYGNASGAVPPVEPLALTRAGSLFLTRPTLFDYIDTVDRRRAAAARLFDMIGSGKVPVEVGQTFPLADAAKAHQALADRATTGSTVLLP
ncbi:quinone oxidoreductase family protein [Sphingomonas nostoxanthinifaciens]|uniref:quinone oxidoreductase family protein n=1 Tax=Sphingomonas nostoxanthinifaciens TaxID=2872652 RepID=UPI001CC214EA|nr:quinone oxidoreductase [Sphingomonas nostoxanthinifaciens]UAK24652.1 quinone oxidoreductase [Sphingomonas nostoxanthinifaciens]